MAKCKPSLPVQQVPRGEWKQDSTQTLTPRLHTLRIHETASSLEASYITTHWKNGIVVTTFVVFVTVMLIMSNFRIVTAVVVEEKKTNEN